MSESQTKERYLTDQEVEREYPLKASFLRNDRCTKRHGIPFIRIGRKVRYRESTIRAYLDKNEIRG